MATATAARARPRSVRRVRLGVRRALGSMPLMWRVFVVNALVLTGAVFLLALTPATVSSPLSLQEGLVLVVGITCLLLLNLYLVRRAFAPLAALAGSMRRFDPLRPGERIALHDADAEVELLADTFNDMADRLEAERRQSAARVMAAQEEERRRLARDLHDEVGQTLTAVVLQLERLSRTTAPDLRPPARRELEESREIVRGTLDEVRRIARELRPDALDELGLTAALSALAAGYSRRTGVPVVRRLEERLPRLSSMGEVAVYRVAQEALTNAARHGRPSCVELELRRPPEGGLVLTVRDDGAGLDPEVAGAGSGIRGMQERALLVGARVTVRARPEGGAEVELRLPESAVGAAGAGADPVA